MRSVRLSRLTERRLTLTLLRGTPCPRKRDKVRRQPPTEKGTAIMTMATDEVIDRFNRAFQDRDR